MLDGRLRFRHFAVLIGSDPLQGGAIVGTRADARMKLYEHHVLLDDITYGIVLGVAGGLP